MKNVMILLMVLLILSSYKSSTQDYEYIKIINLSRKPIVEGMLNGRRAFFLLDTGSDLTVLNSKDAKGYDFKVLYIQAAAYVVSSFGGTRSDILSAWDARIQLGTQEIKAEIHSYDISNIVESLHKHSKVRISGIIGSNIMKKYGFQIDYSKKLVGIRKD